MATKRNFEVTSEQFIKCLFYLCYFYIIYFSILYELHIVDEIPLFKALLTL